MKDDLLKQGPREAPEPETAEERSKRMGMKTAGGGIAAGGIGLAKAGFLGKFLIYLFLWNGVRTAWLLGGWLAIALVAAAVIGYIVYRNRERTA
ncbi:MAG: hypothetical protein E6F98_07230 [Actinobacteria bacterium]|jgi:hypothetical protein|nr:MAG: hypothetical protein E6F98_07230 [Actinomycetota bacterium]